MLRAFVNQINPAEVCFLGPTAESLLPDENGADDIRQQLQKFQTNNTVSYERYCKYLQISG
jgi:hypothetical protein